MDCAEPIAVEILSYNKIHGDLVLVSAMYLFVYAYRSAEQTWRVWLQVRNDSGVVAHRLKWAEVRSRRKAAELYDQLFALCLVANEGNVHGMSEHLPEV